MPVVKH